MHAAIVISMRRLTSMVRNLAWALLSLGVLVSCSTHQAITTPTPVAGPREPQPPAADRRLRVMTYNIKHGQSNVSCTQPPAVSGQPPSPDCNLDLNGTIAVLRAHAPDVVALQEVDRFWARSAYLDGPDG